MKAQYANASIIANNRVVFNMGNDYRLIVAIAYRMQYVFIVYRYARAIRPDRCCDRRPVQIKESDHEVRAIRTDADYRAVLREVSALIDLDPDRENA